MFSLPWLIRAVPVFVMCCGTFAWGIVQTVPYPQIRTAACFGMWPFRFALQGVVELVIFFLRDRPCLMRRSIVKF